MKKVLVIVDVQNDFVDGALGTKEAVEILPYVKEEISKKYDDVFVTFDTHEENYLYNYDVFGNHSWLSILICIYKQKLCHSITG